MSDKTTVVVIIIKGKGNTVTGRKGLQHEREGGGQHERERGGQHHCYKGIKLAQTWVKPTRFGKL